MVVKCRDLLRDDGESKHTDYKDILKKTVYIQL